MKPAYQLQKRAGTLYAYRRRSKHTLAWIAAALVVLAVAVEMWKP